MPLIVLLRSSLTFHSTAPMVTVTVASGSVAYSSALNSTDLDVGSIGLAADDPGPSLLPVESSEGFDEESSPGSFVFCFAELPLFSFDSELDVLSALLSD